MDTPPVRRKPGPHPKGYKRQHIFLPPELADWAKEQEGGLSGLCRRLLDADRKAAERPRRTPAPVAP